jgi:parvulin-like peptidyl-prolyl isomerase
MRKLTRVAAALVLGSSLAASAAGQAPPTQPPAPVPPPVGGLPAPSGVAPTAPQPVLPAVRPTGVAAVVNGQQIPEVAVYRAIRQFPPAHHEAARKEILTHLVENTLIDQYLNALKVQVQDKDVDTLLGELKKELTDAKKDYTKELEALMLTEAEFRAEVTAQMRWEKFVKDQGTDEALKKLFEGSPDVFNGTLVRARHILLTPGTDTAKQQEAANKLRGIKAAVEQECSKAVAAMPPTADALAKETAKLAKAEEVFGAFAKQDSVCPSKQNGGDLNFFPRTGAMVEAFAAAAFGLKPGMLSDVVATEFGYHLILTTARKEGTPKKFEDVKEDVRTLYAMRLREAVINQMKPKAQVTINPAPAK